MRIKKMNFFVQLITFGFAGAVTLAPFGIYVKEEYLQRKDFINHEKIHWKQQMEMLILPFYLWYFVEWFWKTGLYGRNAYYNISFEREAFQYQYDYKYLETRKKFNWFKKVTNDKIF